MSRQVENVLDILRPRLETMTDKDKITIVCPRHIEIRVNGSDPEYIIVEGDGHVDFY